MTKEEVEQLHNGDEVLWTDPDGGVCTRYLVISAIEIIGDVVKIWDKEGGYLECLANELS